MRRPATIAAAYLCRTAPPAPLAACPSGHIAAVPPRRPRRCVPTPASGRSAIISPRTARRMPPLPHLPAITALDLPDRLSSAIKGPPSSTAIPTTSPAGPSPPPNLQRRRHSHSRPPSPAHVAPPLRTTPAQGEVGIPTRAPPFPFPPRSRPPPKPSAPESGRHRRTGALPLFCDGRKGRSGCFAFRPSLSSHSIKAPFPL